MNSVIDIKILLLIGFPIQKSPDLSLFSGSPKLIAADHVFHRLLAPRHPPCALCSLTINLIQLSKNTLYINALSLSGGGKRARTADPLRAKQVLSQLSYTPNIIYLDNLFLGVFSPAYLWWA